MLSCTAPSGGHHRGTGTLKSAHSPGSMLTTRYTMVLRGVDRSKDRQHPPTTTSSRWPLRGITSPRTAAPERGRRECQRHRQRHQISTELEAAHLSRCEGRGGVRDVQQQRGNGTVCGEGSGRELLRTRQSGAFSNVCHRRRGASTALRSKNPVPQLVLAGCMCQHVCVVNSAPVSRKRALCPPVRPAAVTCRL